MATWCEELTHWKRPWCRERLKAGGEGDDRGWDGWMASPTQWRWVWASFWSWWLTGKPGVLHTMELQSRTQLSDWTELNWTELNLIHEGSSFRTPHLLILSNWGVKISTNEFWRNTKIQTITFCLLLFSHVWLFVTQWTTRLLWDSPGKSTGVGCHALLQRIFLTQGSNPCLMSPALADGFFTTSTS